MGLKLGHSLLKCAHIKRGMSIRLRDHDMGEQADRFIALHKAEYTDTISSRCLATFRLRKMNKVEALPLTKDLVALNVFLNAGIKLLTAKLRLGFNYDTWRNLLEFVLCSLIVFNKRRGGEMSRMLLSAYTDRPDWKLWVNQEILDSLSALEKYLLDKLVMPIFHSSLTHYLLIFNNYILQHYSYSFVICSTCVWPGWLVWISSRRLRLRRIGSCVENSCLLVVRRSLCRSMLLLLMMMMMMMMMMDHYSLSSANSGPANAGH